MTDAPKRIQLRRTKGWRKPQGAIVVSRPSPYSNPFRVHYDGPRRWRCDRYTWPTKAKANAEAFKLYEMWLLHDRIPQHLREQDWAPLILGAARGRILNDAPYVLRGHDLACWCPLDQPCHADVLIELANREVFDDEWEPADPPPPEPERNGSFAVGQCCSGCSNPNCPDCGEGIARGDEWMQRQAAADPPVVPAPPTEPECDGRCISAADVGFPELAPAMNAIDPECSLHGDAAASPTVLVELPREVVERYARNHEDVFHPTDYPLVCAAARDALAEKEADR